MHTLVMDTPHYVALDGKLRIGPPLAQLHSGPVCTAIYGFSGKQSYDLFFANSQRDLRPFPLVKTYMQDLVHQPDQTVGLIAIDSAGPLESQLNAATLESVLEALEKGLSHVNVSFRLMLDPATKKYRIEKAPDNDPTSSPASSTVANR